MTSIEEIKLNLNAFVQYSADNFNNAFLVSIEQMLDTIQKLDEVKSNLIQALTELDFNGIQAKTSYGAIALTPSSKINGQWQVTTFDGNLKPWGDLGVVSKREAIDQFLSDVSHNLDVSDICKQLQH